MPSRIATRARPCDSPAVVKRSMLVGLRSWVFGPLVSFRSSRVTVNPLRPLRLHGLRVFLATSKHIQRTCWNTLLSVFRGGQENAEPAESQRTQGLSQQRFGKDVSAAEDTGRIERQLQRRHLTQVLIAEEYSQVVSFQLSHSMFGRQSSPYRRCVF